MSSGPFFVPSVIPNNTQSAMTFYVSPTGSDLNSGLSAGSPLRQVNTALDRLRSFDKIRHLMTIDTAPGSYDGFSAQGLHFDFLTDGSTAGLFIKGALAATTELTQGTATGTITSSVTGSAATGTFTQIVDSAQNWAVNQLKGKLIQWTVGATTTVLVILENDATSFRCTTTSAGPSAGTAYTVSDAGCVADGAPVYLSGNVPTLTTAASAASPCQIIVTGNITSPLTTSIRIEGFRTSVASPTSTNRGIFCDSGGGNVAIGRCQVNSMSAGTPIQLLGSGTVTLTAVVALSAGTVAMIAGGSTLGIAPNVSLNGVLLGSSSTTISSFGGSHGQGVTMFNTQIDGPIGINIVGSCNLSMSSAIRILNGSSQGIRSRSSSSSFGGAVISLLSGSGLVMDGRSVGLELNGMHHAEFVGNLILSNCTRGIVCERGSSCGVSAGSSMTATSGAELTVDELTDTLANMRAATPKAFKNPSYFSVIYE